MKPTVMVWLIAVGLSVTALAGCAHGVYPVTTGFHTPIDPNVPQKVLRVVIWSNNAGAEDTIIEMMQQNGVIVVERARLQQILDEQNIRLTHTRENDANILNVGKLLGADRVIFAEATITETVLERALINANGGSARPETGYNLSVAIRGVDVETGEIRWSGSGQYPAPVSNPNVGIVYLTKRAVQHALCPVEVGYVWMEPGELEKTGCINKK